jgi:hypothetical protein
MANYATTSGLQATSLALMEHVADLKFKKVWEQLIGIMTTEFAAAVTGQDGYTVTTTLVAQLEAELINLSDTYMQNILRSFFGQLAAEFALAGDGTMFNYTVSASTDPRIYNFKQMLQDHIGNTPDALKREALFEYADLMFTEFTAIAAASA